MNQSFQNVLDKLDQLKLLLHVEVENQVEPRVLEKLIDVYVYVRNAQRAILNAQSLYDKTWEEEEEKGGR